MAERDSTRVLPSAGDGSVLAVSADDGDSPPVVPVEGVRSWSATLFASWSKAPVAPTPYAATATTAAVANTPLRDPAASPTPGAAVHVGQEAVGILAGCALTERVPQPAFEVVGLVVVVGGHHTSSDGESVSRGTVARSLAIALDACDLIVPTETPRVRAISASDMSS